MPNRPSMGERVSKLTDTVQGSQAWSSIFRPGSIFRKGYTDSPRNRSYVYRPTTALAWQDISTLHTSVAFGLLVRNMHRWAAHLMVITVFLHMARVFYHGAYKPPREFNWVIGVILLTLTLLLSFTGYLLPWDQLSLWAVTVGTNMMGYTPVFGTQVRFVLLGGAEIGGPTLLRWYVLHVLMLPFVIVIFMAIHFWRVRKDGGISGPL
jgi:quinol-cytochrome oxidoreductase complex cytochrome b subunit